MDNLLLAAHEVDVVIVESGAGEKGTVWVECGIGDW